jgi:hypothetical protein
MGITKKRFLDESTALPTLRHYLENRRLNQSDNQNWSSDLFPQVDWVERHRGQGWHAVCGHSAGKGKPLVVGEIIPVRALAGGAKRYVTQLTHPHVDFWVMPIGQARERCHE